MWAQRDTTGAWTLTSDQPLNSLSKRASAIGTFTHTLEA